MSIVSNGLTRDFIADTLSSKENRNFLKAVESYVTYWQIHEKPKDKCTFCMFVFRHGKTETELNQIKYFAAKMPVNCTGTVFVWYFILKTFKLSPRDVLQVDPESIFLHLLLHLCGNNTTLSSTMEREVLTSVRLTSQISKLLYELEQDVEVEVEQEDGAGNHQRKEENLFLEYSDCETDEAEENDETKHTCTQNKGSYDRTTSLKRTKKTNDTNDHTPRKDMKNKAKQLQVSSSILVDNLRKGGCYGYDSENKSRCIYSNTGAYEMAAMNNTLDVDARLYVSPHWVKEHMFGTSLHSYYGMKGFMKFQPGLVMRHTREQCNAYSSEHDMALSDMIKKRSRTGSEKMEPHASKSVTSLFAIEGDLNDTSNLASANNLEDIRPYMDTYSDNVNNLHDEMLILHRLHVLCHNPRTYGMTLIQYSTSSYPCLWCTLGISPGFRHVLHDLAVMAEQKKVDSGMKTRGRRMCGSLMTGDDSVFSKYQRGTANRCEKESLKSTLSSESHIENGSSRKRKSEMDAENGSVHQSDISYSLDFENIKIRCEPIHAIFHNWAESKYPFMKTFLEEIGLTDKEECIKGIGMHCTSDGNIYCLCNNRRLFTDTDCHMRQNHMCLLPTIVRNAQTIVKVLGIVKTSKNLMAKIPKLTACHHMCPRI